MTAVLLSFHHLVRPRLRNVLNGAKPGFLRQVFFAFGFFIGAMAVAPPAHAVLCPPPFICAQPPAIAAAFATLGTTIVNTLLGDPAPTAFTSTKNLNLQLHSQMATSELKNAWATERTRLQAKEAAKLVDLAGIDAGCAIRNAGMAAAVLGSGGLPGIVPAVSGNASAVDVIASDLQKTFAFGNMGMKLPRNGGGGGGQEDSFIFPELQKAMVFQAICDANLPPGWKNSVCEGVDPDLKIIRYSEMLGRDVIPTEKQEDADRLGAHLWMSAIFETPPQLVSAEDFLSPEGTDHTVEVLQAATRASYGGAPIARSAAEAMSLKEIIEKRYPNLPEAVKKIVNSDCDSEKCVVKYLATMIATPEFNDRLAGMGSGALAGELAYQDAIYNLILWKWLERTRMQSEIEGVSLINQLREDDARAKVAAP